MEDINQTTAINNHYSALLYSIYFQNQRTLADNPLKESFQTAVETVTYEQTLTERDLRHQNGRMDPVKLTQFLQDVGSELGADPQLIDDMVDTIAVEEHNQLLEDQLYANYNGEEPIDINTRTHEWFVEGFERVYGAPFDYKEFMRQAANDPSMQPPNAFNDAPEQEEPDFMSGAIDDIDFSGLDQLLDTYAPNNKSVESDYSSAVQKDVTAFRDTLDNFRYRQPMDRYSQFSERFEWAVQATTFDLNIDDQALRDSTGTIDAEAFKKFIEQVGVRLNLPEEAAQDVASELAIDEAAIEHLSPEPYEWFVEEYRSLYGQPFDMAYNEYKNQERETAQEGLSADDSLFGVSLDVPVDTIASEASISLSEGRQSKTVDFINQIKDARQPQDLARREAFELSTNEMIEGWGVKREQLVSDGALFKDWMTQTLVNTSEKSDRSPEDRLTVSDAQSALNRAFGPQIQRNDIEEFADGYAAVYQAPIDAYNLTMSEVHEALGFEEPSGVKGLLLYKDVFEAESAEAIEALERQVLRDVQEEMEKEVETAVGSNDDVVEDDGFEF